MRVKLSARLSVTCCLHCTVYISYTTLYAVYIMDFSLNTLYDLEKELDSVFGSVFGANLERLSKSTVMKTDKGVLANLVVSVAGVLGKSRTALHSAAVSIEELKSDQIQNQKTLLKLQDTLIQSKAEQVEAVQTTVKTEIRSFSDVIKQGCEDKITATKLTAVVKSAVESDDRKKAVMVFGLEESANEEVGGKVDKLLGTVCTMGRPVVGDCFRVGATKPGAVRPVKVLFHSSEVAARVLRSSTSLRETCYSRVYITPDRTLEERNERRTLVTAMKEKIGSEPQRYHYIRNGTVCSREKVSRPTPETAPSPHVPATVTRTLAPPTDKSGVLPPTPGSFRASVDTCRRRSAGLNNTR